MGRGDPGEPEGDRRRPPRQDDGYRGPARRAGEGAEGRD